MYTNKPRVPETIVLLYDPRDLDHWLAEKMYRSFGNVYTVVYDQERSDARGLRAQLAELCLIENSRLVVLGVPPELGLMQEALQELNAKWSDMSVYLPNRTLAQSLSDAGFTSDTTLLGTDEQPILHLYIHDVLYAGSNSGRRATHTFMQMSAIRLHYPHLSWERWRQLWRKHGNLFGRDLSSLVAAVNAYGRAHARLIALEGLDGSGKDTQIELLTNALIERGYRVSVVREVDATSTNQALFNVLANGEHPRTNAQELLTWTAIREGAQEAVKTALEHCDIVIMNRYIYSTLAMQGLAMDQYVWARGLQDRFLQPAHVIYLQRHGSMREQLWQRDTLDHWEVKDQDYHDRLDHHFSELANVHCPACTRWHTTPTGAIASIHEDVLNYVLEHVLTTPVNI